MAYGVNPAVELNCLERLAVRTFGLKVYVAERPEEFELHIYHGYEVAALKKSIYSLGDLRGLMAAACGRYRAFVSVLEDRLLQLPFRPAKHSHNVAGGSRASSMTSRRDIPCSMSLLFRRFNLLLIVQSVVRLPRFW